MFNTQFSGYLSYLGAVSHMAAGLSIAPQHPSLHPALVPLPDAALRPARCVGTRDFDILWHTHFQPGLGSSRELEPFNCVKCHALGCSPANALCALPGVWLHLPLPVPGSAAWTYACASEVVQWDQCQGAARDAYATHCACGMARKRGERMSIHGASSSREHDGACRTLSRTDVLVLSKT